MGAGGGSSWGRVGSVRGAFLERRFLFGGWLGGTAGPGIIVVDDAALKEHAIGATTSGANGVG